MLNMRMQSTDAIHHSQTRMNIGGQRKYGSSVKVWVRAPHRPLVMLPPTEKRRLRIVPVVTQRTRHYLARHDIGLRQADSRKA